MIKRIVVVGGGFAGWYTSACLQLHVPGIEITQIESPKIPRLRVGETLGFGAPGWFRHLIGLDNEKELMRQTGSIYKFGVHNIDFADNHESVAHGNVKNFTIDSLHLPAHERKHYTGPTHAAELLDNLPSHHGGIFEAWLYINQHNPNKNSQQFIDEMYDSSHFCTNPLLPFDQNNQLILESNHSYHFDAEEMVSYLKNAVLSRTNNFKFNHIVANVVDIEQHNDGSIATLILDTEDKITGDLYIDCTGLGRVLAKHTHRGLWTDLQGYNNSAWVCPTKYDDPAKEMTGATKIIGDDHGWRFLVNLYHRQGNGYVFNNTLVDSEKVGGVLDQLTSGQQLVAPRLIKWNPGLFQQPWFTNCLALGVANCFFDPWDAPVFSEHSQDLWDLVESISALNDQPIKADTVKKEYNKKSLMRSEERRVRYLIAHGLSSRSGPYWDHVRQLAKQEDIDTKFEKIATSGVTGNINVYAKLMILNNTDISKWTVSKLTDQDLIHAKKYFQAQKNKNQQIRGQAWPNSYEWFKQNLFDGATSQEIYEEFSHRH